MLRPITLVAFWHIFLMYFLLFLHDWNHAWRIHPIFSNTSNNLPKNQPFWLEVIWCVFWKILVYLFYFWSTVYILCSLYHVTYMVNTACEFLRWMSNKNNNGNNHAGFRLHNCRGRGLLNIPWNNINMNWNSRTRILRGMYRYNL